MKKRGWLRVAPSCFAVICAVLTSLLLLLLLLLGPDGEKIDTSDMLRAIGKQHEAEKKNAYNEFAEYKMRVKEKEKQMVQQVCILLRW